MITLAGATVHKYKCIENDQVFKHGICFKNRLYLHESFVVNNLIPFVAENIHNMHNHISSNFLDDE